MSKKTKDKLVDNSEETLHADFVELAYGLHKVHTENGAIFELVEIKYDPIAGVCDAPRVLAKDVYEDIVDKFKIQAAENLLTRSKG